MVLPFALSALAAPLLVAGGAGRLLRARRGPGRFGPVAIGLGSLAGFVLLADGLPILQSVAHPRLGEALVGLCAVSLLLAVLGDAVAGWPLVGIGAGLVAAAWPFGLQALAVPDNATLGLAAAAALGAVVTMRRLAVLGGLGAAPVGVVAVLALGLGAIGAAARTGMLAGLALALAMSCLGWLLAARPLAKAVSAIAAILAGATLVVLSVEIVLTALHPPWALILLPAGLWSDAIARRLPMLSGLMRRKAQRPYAVIAAAAVPAGLAAGLALLMALDNTLVLTPLPGRP